MALIGGLGQTFTVYAPGDWKIFHKKNLDHIDPDIHDLAVAFLKGFFSEGHVVADEIRRAHAKNHQTWWARYHTTWGMSMRNLLRRAGYDEKRLGVSNLDDVYVGLIEEALGLL